MFSTLNAILELTGDDFWGCSGMPWGNLGLCWGHLGTTLGGLGRNLGTPWGLGLGGWGLVTTTHTLLKCKNRSRLTPVQRKRQHEKDDVTKH